MNIVDEAKRRAVSAVSGRLRSAAKCDYCATIVMVPLDAGQVELAALLYDPEIVEESVGTVPVVLMMVLLEVSVMVMVKLPVLVVVALADSELPLMHMLLGMPTLPV
jgi:hypothetical protein